MQSRGQHLGESRNYSGCHIPHPDRSSVVICDCSDRNPNVFYEIGIAHTLGREVILITQSEADIPFDLLHLRYVRYLNNPEGRTAFSAALLPKPTELAASKAYCKAKMWSPRHLDNIACPATDLQASTAQSRFRIVGNSEVVVCDESFAALSKPNGCGTAQTGICDCLFSVTWG